MKENILTQADIDSLEEILNKKLSKIIQERTSIKKASSEWDNVLLQAREEFFRG